MAIRGVAACLPPPVAHRAAGHLLGAGEAVAVLLLRYATAGLHEVPPVRVRGQVLNHERPPPPYSAPWIEVAASSPTPRGRTRGRNP